jgi:hypothetical protein
MARAGAGSEDATLYWKPRRLKEIVLVSTKPIGYNEFVIAKL